MSKNRFLSVTTTILSCGLGSLVLFSASKTLANAPASSARFLSLNIDYQQCITEAREAAGIIMSEVNNESYTPNEGIIGFFAQTSESRASVMCIQDGQNSIFTVVANGEAYSDRRTGETKSIGDRFIQIMSDDL